MLKRFLAVAPAALFLLYGLWIGPKYDRYVLPAFDGYVYDAMAESPRIFTLPPWGYRILAPWIVHVLPFPTAAEGFFWLTLTCLTASVFLLGEWLRLMGFSPVTAFLGGLSLAATPPFQDLIDYQVLVDPLSLLVYLAILRQFVEPSTLGLAALLGVGALTKEVCLLPALALPFVLSSRMGWTAGVAKSLAVAAPAAGLSILIRTAWTQAPGRGFAASHLRNRHNGGTFWVDLGAIDGSPGPGPALVVWMFFRSARQPLRLRLAGPAARRAVRLGALSASRSRRSRRASGHHDRAGAPGTALDSKSPSHRRTPRLRNPGPPDRRL
jgi:hypothetical protein